MVDQMSLRKGEVPQNVTQVCWAQLDVLEPSFLTGLLWRFPNSNQLWHVAFVIVCTAKFLGHFGNVAAAITSIVLDLT